MKIINKDVLSDVGGVRILRMDILSPLLAAKALPGEFIVLMISEQGERIPLTVVDKDIAKGAITLIFQEAGLTTRLLGRMNQGDSLYSIVGPLGHATAVKNYGNVAIAGGGAGIAEIYPVTKALKAAGNRITTIIGARTRGLLILEKELKAVSDELHVTTDDGSYGRKGFVTDVLKDVIANNVGARCSVPLQLVYAVGPIPMMKAVSAVTNKSGIKTIVSLNALMLDGTGMCGICRVTVAGVVKLTCSDGPEFDGHLVDWDELDKRNRAYIDKEKHICNIYKV